MQFLWDLLLSSFEGVPPPLHQDSALASRQRWARLLRRLVRR